VLGRLMIVHEKLSQAQSNGVQPSFNRTLSAPSTPTHGLPFRKKINNQSQHLNLAQHIIINQKDSLEKRMAHSPKFAKFKKKRMTNDPPIRICNSGSNTPRSVSPTDIVSAEEKKRREAKLIEALALTAPKQPQKPNSKAKGDVDKAKRNIHDKNKPKDESETSARQRPIQPKRNKVAEKTDKPADSAALLNLHTVKIKEEPMDTSDDTDVVVVHEEVPPPPPPIPQPITVPNTPITEVVMEDSTPIIIKAEGIKPSVQTSLAHKVQPIVEAKSLHNDTNNNDSIKTSKDVPKPKSSGPIKPPRNYRNDRSSCAKDSCYNSDSDDSDVDEIKKKKRFSRLRNKSVSPGYQPSRLKRSSRSRSPHRSASRLRSRSRSPHSRSSSVSSRHGSSHKSSRSNRPTEDEEDVKEVLSDLSNPVPYDIEHERKLKFLCGNAKKDKDIERRNIYAGGITREMTKQDLIKRFQRFGMIEKITMHFREKGDSYAFIIFEEPEDAMRAIEEGNDDPKYKHLELCFGGRRRFVGGSYVDFDGNNSYLEEAELAPSQTRGEPVDDDFDNLLRMAMKQTKKKQTVDPPEWT